jgi:hypothetical protein
LRDTTGKTTLMLELVTPLDEVLAVVTELGPPALRVERTALRGDEDGRDAAAYMPPPMTARAAATIAI